MALYARVRHKYNNKVSQGIQKNSNSISFSIVMKKAAAQTTYVSVTWIATQEEMCRST